ncbi:hypothetical protein Moror_16709, partial [Moniliophthora roreri MCA 2997]
STAVTLLRMCQCHISMKTCPWTPLIIILNLAYVTSLTLLSRQPSVFADLSFTICLMPSTLWYTFLELCAQHVCPGLSSEMQIPLGCASIFTSTPCCLSSTGNPIKTPLMSCINSMLTMCGRH